MSWVNVPMTARFAMTQTTAQTHEQQLSWGRDDDLVHLAAVASERPTRQVQPLWAALPLAARFGCAKRLRRVASVPLGWVDLMEPRGC